MKEVELLAETTVIALFGLFQHVQIGVEIFLLGPCRTVDALQLLVAMIATPVGTGHLHELEDLELGRRWHVRATAKVDEIAFAVERNLLIGGNGANQLGLVFFTEIEEELDRIVARPYFPCYRNILLGQLSHALFDRHQVFRGKRTLVGEVVIEAVFDDRSNGDLCVGEQLLDRISKQMGGRVTDQLEAVRVALGHDSQIDIFFDQIRGIDQIAIDLAAQCSASQASTDAGRHFGDCYRLFKRADGTIRQFDIRHGKYPGEKKVRG